MRSLTLFAAAAVAGCSQPAMLAQSDVAQETAGRVAGAPQSCVGTLPDQNLRVLDPQTLAYGWGNTIYLNRLPGPCPALRPLNTLIVSAQPGQYCRGDQVSGNEPGSIIPGPACNLGDWIPHRRP